ncbi:lipopolysaccharide biosynthesis protein [Gelidibacter maritimus]|uniref:Sugar transporter n=1 Tax=Gelidibacter maritimus TaxID=2761487 RepID=A0A7W2M6F0_9FLAO|nr:sugar transporter [Gelidibacter maritimus]MBA6153571.1 sugar transporter [Gelidibacter maritimus]
MSRVSKSLKNAKVGLFFYSITIFVAFFSRKIFLDYLGADFIGLISVLQSILGFLNIAELGVGTAIGYALYKPIFDGDKKEINQLIQYFGHLYKKIGLAILVLSLLVSIFFPFFFTDVPFTLPLIYFAFFTFVLSSLVGYFLNYHVTLFQADQKEYLLSKYVQTAGILKSVLQITLIYNFANYYAWITVELLFVFVIAIVLRWRVKKSYPWLKITLDKNAKYIKYPEILVKIKQIVVHKISFFVLVGTDQILIYAFVNLQSVAFFSNYQLIFGYIQSFVNNGFTGSQASIGNLIAENDFHNTNKVFWEMMAIRCFFGGFLFIILYFSTGFFIDIWLGGEFVLSDDVLILMCANIYISQARKPVDDFINGYGLFADTWAPITETLLNLSISILLGFYFGITGILLGTFISTFLIVVLWKPYYLYTQGFKILVWHYWKDFFKLLFSFLITFLLLKYITKNNLNTEPVNFFDWAIYSGQVSILIFLIYVILLYLLNQGFRDFIKRIKKMIIQKRKR